MSFIDRVAEFPGRIKLTAVSGQTDTYDVERKEGTIYTTGTLLNAANLNQQTQLDNTVRTAFTNAGMSGTAQNEMSNALNFLLNKVRLFDQQLTMSVHPWGSGVCTVTDSGKYRAFMGVVSASGDSSFPILILRLNTQLVGYNVFTNTTAGNYNQYTMSFRATIDGEDWTMQACRQITHVGTGQHGGTTDLVVNSIRGLIPFGF